MKNTLAIIFFTTLIFNACTDTTTQTVAPLKAVVQGYISPNHTMDIFISKELSVNDTTTVLQPVDNLSVKIDYNGKTAPLTNVSGGHYISNFKVDSNTTYRMYFDYGGQTVEATTNVPTKPVGFASNATTITLVSFNPSNPTSVPTFPAPIELTWSNPNNDYYLVAAESTDSAAIEVFTRSSGQDAPRRQFRNNPTNANTSEIRSRQFVYFGNYNLVLYHINGDYASLYNDNGANSLNLTSPYTNVKNGAGIFTGIATDTIKFFVKKG